MNDLTPEEIQMIIAAGENDPELAKVKRQQAMIDQLRNKSQQTPQTQMAGQIALPNWGQQIGNAVSGFRAEQMQPGVDSTMKGVTDRTVAARQAFLKRLTESLRRDASQVMPSDPPDTMMGP
mgnify:FL=1